MYQSRTSVTTGMMLLLIGGILTAVARPSFADDAPAKPLTLRDVVSDLAKEAQVALKEDKPLPRTSSDYAKTKGNAKLDERDLMTGLTRSTDRNPLVDSYIKWQLLSFNPDFASMKPAELVKIIDAIPAREVANQMEPRQQAMVKAAASGRGNLAQLQKVIEDYKTKQKQIDALNKPNKSYSSAVFKAAATDKGVAMIALVRNLELTLEGGDEKGFGAVTKQLIDQTKELRTDQALSGPIRNELRRRIHQVASKSCSVVSGLSLKASGETTYSEKTLKLADAAVNEMDANLMGREYTPAKKK